ncbi:hypothetical protein RhiirC2_789704 [Rhizophagus irregularis]|uniref:Uncharacterized protein n=1 Tax=Rhizophagus irregularis TaxID=588596 RepID=A0A2N1MML5_9GLOM|nr:hypothetical protein RhiirC2_789704 [Rhizophagus irregularis]
MLLAQKKKFSGPDPEVIRLFSGLTDLNYKSSYNNHMYFQNLSISKDDVAIRDTYDPEEILNKYIVRVVGNGFTIVDHPSEIYIMPDAHECIDGNLPLRLVLDIDARQKPFFSFIFEKK